MSDEEYYAKTGFAVGATGNLDPRDLPRRVQYVPVYSKQRLDNGSVVTIPSVKPVCSKWRIFAMPGSIFIVHTPWQAPVFGDHSIAACMNWIAAETIYQQMKAL